jgi:hypothetical protein
MQMSQGDDVNANPIVRITAVPPGEAPFWVREKWVGLELPVAHNSAPKTLFAYGVLSSPRHWLTQWLGILLGRAQRITGYAVESTLAVDILATSNPEAAAWWRRNTAYLIGPGRYLVFPEHVCRSVDITNPG